jgi:hypothetical protein
LTTKARYFPFCLLLVTLGWSIAMGIEVGGAASKGFTKPNSCSYFSGKPILNLELASSPDCFLNLVAQGVPDKVEKNARLFRINTYMDFVFIALYWSVFSCFVIAERRRWAKWVIGFISISAFFDVLENARILEGLNDVLACNQVHGVLARPFSLLKWTALAFALGCLGASLWTLADWRTRLLSTVLLAAGALTLAGLVVPMAMIGAGYCLALVFVLLIVRLWPTQV